jgi:phosphoribosylaminoimidazole-succinocarboxamide synthase
VSKVIQKIRAWKYPCEPAIRNHHIGGFIFTGVDKNKKELVSWLDRCYCGKNCEPIKIEIIVRKVGKK